MELVLIRHAPVIGMEGICYGQTEVEPNPEEEKALVEKLKIAFHERPGVVFSSPSQRCSRIAAELSSSFQTHSALQEMHFGDWENKPWDHIPSEELHRWMSDFVNVAPPHGESWRQMVARIDAWTKVHLLSEERVWMIAHAGTLRAFLHLLTGLGLEHVFRVQVDPGCKIEGIWQEEPCGRKLTALDSGLGW